MDFLQNFFSLLELSVSNYSIPERIKKGINPIKPNIELMP